MMAVGWMPQVGFNPNSKPRRLRQQQSTRNNDTRIQMDMLIVLCLPLFSSSPFVCVLFCAFRLRCWLVPLVLCGVGVAVAAVLFRLSPSLDIAIDTLNRFSTLIAPTNTNMSAEAAAPSNTCYSFSESGQAQQRNDTMGGAADGASAATHFKPSRVDSITHSPTTCTLLDTHSLYRLLPLR